ncbi:MAG: AAA family ATPase [Ilumatobacteraceae bacterium]
MKYHKLKVLSTSKVEEGLELPVTGTNFSFQQDQIITYAIDYGELEETAPVPNELEQFLKDQEKKKREQDYEFKEKFQIRCGVNFFDSETGLRAIPLETEKFYETSTSRFMLKLFDNFFQKCDTIAQKFKRNKRAYLLHSEPGMGKSAMIRHFCRQYLEHEGTAILQVGGEVDFQKLTTIFLQGYAEDVKRIVLIIEDFGRRDYANNTSIYNPSCLNFLDGVAGLFRVPTLILCTTNFIDHLGPQLTNRPGRFNRIIRVQPPSDDEVFELVEGVAGIKLTDDQKAAFAGKGMTPDHAIEALLRHEIEEIELAQAAEEVMKEREGLTTWK